MLWNPKKGWRWMDRNHKTYLVSLSLSSLDTNFFPLKVESHWTPQLFASCRWNSSSHWLRSWRIFSTSCRMGMTSLLTLSMRNKLPLLFISALLLSGELDQGKSTWVTKIGKQHMQQRHYDNLIQEMRLRVTMKCF